MPDLTLPAVLGRDELPVAITLAGMADGDAALLAAGIAFQALTPWHELRPEID
jgi:Asp-tRNA(Asn)/Glu-tRNA(Gln) amidotransferase A subunit family amidase